LPDLINLSAQLELTDLPDTPCYPLLRCGERFPIYDPNLSPQIPQDKSGKNLLRALLAGLVNIEKTAYQRLAEFSGQSINRIFCVGGGCCNPAWQALRKQQLPARLYPAHSNDAAFGVTQLLTNHKQ
jgi:sugar (pentulose or hexulose) kinase